MRPIDGDSLECKIFEDERMTFTKSDMASMVINCPTLSVVSEHHHQSVIKGLKGEISELTARNATQKETIKKLMAYKQKRGTWSVKIDEDDDPLFWRKFVCSCCGQWQTYGMSNYCPKCGAKMIGENNG